MSKSLNELIETFREENKAYCLEGKRGLIFLCKFVRALGYRDVQKFGQLSQDASVGDLVEFFEDNPGAIDAIIDWIGITDNEEWKESLKLHINSEEEEEV